MTDTTYRLLVTGPRAVPDERPVIDALTRVRSTLPGPVTLVHGACPSGVDAIADRWGNEMSAVLGMTVERHPAQKHPSQDFGSWPGAGPRRNAYMSSLGADVCVAFLLPCQREKCRNSPAHTTHGTTSCVNLATREGIPVERFYL